MKHYSLFLLLAVSFLLTGCGNSGIFVASNTTEVELSEGNYQIVAQNVSGSAESAYIIGASISWGAATQTFGLIPAGGTKTMYKDAREALWTNYTAKHGPVEGKRLALVNVQYDATTANYVLYTKAQITVTADVIEFE